MTKMRSAKGRRHGADARKKVAKITGAALVLSAIVAWSTVDVAHADQRSSSRCTPSFQPPERGSWSGTWDSTQGFLYSGTSAATLIFTHSKTGFAMTGLLTEYVTADPLHVLASAFGHGTEPPLPFELISGPFQGTISCGGTLTVGGSGNFDTFTGTVAYDGMSATGTYQNLAYPVGGGTPIVVDSGTWSIKAVPSVSAVRPNQGRTSGGQVIHIKGASFRNVTAVHFGTQLATIMSTNHRYTTVTVKDPAGTGTVDVTVTNANGTSSVTPMDKFTYS
jgi:hypothetical protein